MPALHRKLEQTPVDLPMEITCPACRESFEGADELRGQNTRCPTCRALFMVMQAPPTPLTWQIPCPACRHIGSFLSLQEGDWVTCDRCQMGFQVNEFEVLTDLPLEVGEVYQGRYQVIEAWQGSIGPVYRVFHQRWNRELAARLPHKDYFPSREAKRAFMQELHPWVLLPQHPHVAACYYARDIEEHVGVFADFVPGGSLGEALVTGRLHAGSEAEVLQRILRVAIQTAMALEFAHGHALIHAHLSPENILLEDDGTVKLTDFAVYQARQAVELPGRDTEMRQASGCSIDYCAPEQAELEGAVHQSDLWTWALVVLEMFCGERTWPIGPAGDQAYLNYCQEALSAAAAGTRVYPQIPLMPESLMDMLHPCFNHNPTRRPESMEVVIDDLRAVYGELTGSPYMLPNLDPGAQAANSLNNLAIALNDLGRTQEADECLDEAVKNQPDHPEATFNRCLLQWRKGNMTDTAVLELMYYLSDTGARLDRVHYLQSQIHLERGDSTEAVALLEPLATGRLATREVRLALQMAQQLASERGTQSRELVAHRAKVTAIGLSLHGRYLLSAGRDTALQLWDTGSGKALNQFSGHTTDVHTICFSPDEQLVLTGSGDWNGPPELDLPLEGDEELPGESTLRLWEARTGKSLRSFAICSPVASVCFSQQGKFAMSLSRDNLLRIWDLQTGRCIHRLPAWGQQGMQIGLLPDGNSVVAPSMMSETEPGPVGLWDLKAGRCRRVFAMDDPHPGPFALSADGALLLTGSGEAGKPARLHIWDVASGTCMGSLLGHDTGIALVAMGPSCRYALSVDLDGMMRLWELGTTKCVRTFAETGVAAVTFLPSSPENPVAAYAIGDKIVLAQVGVVADPPPSFSRLMLDADETPARNRLQAYIIDIERTLDQGRLIAANDMIEKALAIPEHAEMPELHELYARLGLHGRRTKLKQHELRFKLESQAGGFLSLGFNNNGSLLMAAGNEGAVHAWNVATGEPYYTWQSGLDKLQYHVFAKSCDAAVSLHFGNHIVFWDLHRGEAEPVLHLDKSPGTALAISPQGEFCVAGMGDNTFGLYDLADGALIRVFSGHTNRVTSLDVSPDGMVILSASLDQTVRVWQASTGHAMRATEPLGGPIRIARFSSEGRRALIGLDGNPLIVWDLMRNRRLFSVGSNASRPESMGLSFDNNWLLVSDRVKGLDAQPDVNVWLLEKAQKETQLEGIEGLPLCTAFSPDGSVAVAASANRTLYVWGLKWDFSLPETPAWVDEAWPYLRCFLALRTPLSDEDPTDQAGMPEWSAADLPVLMRQLQWAGLGAIPQAEVERHLTNLGAVWSKGKSVLD